jgi:hypothetical protein
MSQEIPHHVMSAARRVEADHFAYGFGTLSSKLVRNYANGVADGFLNDLAAGHIAGIDSENALIEAFIRYVGACANASKLTPCAAATSTP